MNRRLVPADESQLKLPHRAGFGAGECGSVNVIAIWVSLPRSAAVTNQDREIKAIATQLNFEVGIQPYRLSRWLQRGKQPRDENHSNTAQLRGWHPAVSPTALASARECAAAADVIALQFWSETASVHGIGGLLRTAASTKRDLEDKATTIQL